jgi:hypothetical protein
LLKKRSVVPIGTRPVPYYDRVMRGDDERPDAMFSYVSAEERIPADHPLRAIRVLVDDILREMSRDFSRRYSMTGR